MGPAELKQTHGVNPGALVLCDKLPYSLLSLPDVVASKHLKPLDYAAYFVRKASSLSRVGCWSSKASFGTAKLGSSG